MRKCGPTIYTRSSATAERQRVSYTRLSRLTHWSCTSLSTASVLQLYRVVQKRGHSTFSQISRKLLKISKWFLHTSRQTRIDTISRQTVRHANFKLNRAFKVIQSHPYWCRQESRMVCCRNVQLMPTLFLKLTKIRQRVNGKFVDFNNHTQVWRRPSKKRLWISTNDLYCQKLELLTYILAADSMDICSLVFTQLCLKVTSLVNLKLLVQKPSFI